MNIGLKKWGGSTLKHQAKGRRYFIQPSCQKHGFRQALFARYCVSTSVAQASGGAAISWITRSLACARSGL